MSSPLDLAAILPDEADILAAVAGAPADDTAKLVYADWLDEHDDPRGPFLRRFAGAVRDGTELPEPAGLPAAWLEIIGFPLAARIRALGLNNYRSTILPLARPAVAIDTKPRPEHRFPVGGTKFGGLPDLPAGVDWPRCDRGPLEFLGQFDLSEVSRTVAGRVLPSSGLLSFFLVLWYSQDEHGGDGGGLRVIYTPGGTRLGRAALPEDMPPDLDRSGEPCRLSLADALSVPDPIDIWTAADQPEFTRSVKLGELESRLLDGAPHQLFGYPDRPDAVECLPPGPDWRFLLRLSSDDKLGWCWGDGHVLYWYLRDTDLHTFRFEGARVIDVG